MSKPVFPTEHSFNRAESTLTRYFGKATECGGEKENTEQAEDKFSTSETVGAVRSIIYSLCVNTGNTHQVDRGSQERKTKSGKMLRWWTIVDGGQSTFPRRFPLYHAQRRHNLHYTTVPASACCISVALACVEKESHLWREALTVKLLESAERGHSKWHARIVPLEKEHNSMCLNNLISSRPVQSGRGRYESPGREDNRSLLSHVSS